jgi:uncharacterized protein YmfQ (DUF2313 family)
MALLADLPPYLQDDPYVRGIVDAAARELQRVEDAAQSVRQSAFPQNADDTYGFLSLWESLLGIPVNPTGASLSERRNQVLSNLRLRTSGYGTDWVALLSQAMGSNPWGYQEGPGSYQITVRIPFSAGGYSSAQVEALARKITPAHLDLAVTYNEGFLVGIGLVGQDRI